MRGNNKLCYFALDMITSAQHLREHYRVEQGVSDAAINDAIRAALAWLQEMIGGDHVTQVANNQSWVDGGDAVQITQAATAPFVGFANLIDAGAVSYLITTQQVVVTGFGIVKKRDEYSEQADTFWPAKTHELIMRQGVQRFCQLAGWPCQTPDTTATTTKFFVSR